jgi:hypothetical protein
MPKKCLENTDMKWQVSGENCIVGIFGIFTLKLLFFGMKPRNLRWDIHVACMRETKKTCFILNPFGIKSVGGQIMRCKIFKYRFLVYLPSHFQFRWSYNNE